ncbi:signal peptidase complex subunit 1 [Strigops habroptila]|uniref:Signal peptidase complex subunit 1 n=3 Tax=Telluraves TaxID=3073808 RepID=A0A672VEC5_STRHB|nr:signal peptidase complex subunit 1 [Strigops habroptila]
MEAQGDGCAEEPEAEAQAQARSRSRSSSGSDGSAEPTAETGDCRPELTKDGAERKGSASGQISSPLPLLRHRAEPGYPPSRSSASQGFGEDEEDDYDEEQDDEECEAPLSAAAMLNIFRSIPTQMDYKGQKLAEQIFQGIILVSAIIGFIYGYITEQFGWTVYIVMAGFALSCLLTLPPWPMYRRNPLKWLPVQESGTEDKKPADRKPKRHAKS